MFLVLHEKASTAARVRVHEVGWEAKGSEPQAERRARRSLAREATEARRALPSARDAAAVYRAREPAPWFGPEQICRPLRPPPIATARDWYLMMPSFTKLGVDFVPGQLPRESEPIEALLAI